MKYILILMTLLIASQLEAKQKFYKWTDADGNVHYSEKKPRNSDSDEIKVFSEASTALIKEQAIDGSSIPESEKTDQQKVVDEYNRTENEKIKEAQDKANCAIAKKNLIALKQSTRMNRKDPDTGEYLSVDETQKKKMLKDVKKQLKDLCQ